MAETQFVRRAYTSIKKVDGKWRIDGSFPRTFLPQEDGPGVFVEIEPTEVTISRVKPLNRSCCFTPRLVEKVCKEMPDMRGWDWECTARVENNLMSLNVYTLQQWRFGVEPVLSYVVHIPCKTS
jgi:hypothetical protein